MIQKSNRRTKIVWSLEGRCINVENSRELRPEDVDALRLVYDHGSLEDLKSVLKEISSRPTRERIPVMIDFSSQVRARIGSLKEPRELKYGERVLLAPPGKKGDLEITSDEWKNGALFAPDAIVYFGFGNVVLRVSNVTPQGADCEVVQGGIALPSADVHVPSTRKESPLGEIVSDQELAMFLDYGVDYLLIPGVCSVLDLERLRQKIAQKSKSGPWIVGKIDSDRVYDNYQNLLPVVDGILISRLEMALTINPATIPILTKEMIQGANEQAKLVFIASEMLGSMRHNATPTRAEVSDVANAVLDGADAVVASEEISYGDHRMRSVKLMGRIVADVEAQSATALNWLKRQPEVQSEMDAVAFGAYKTAERMSAKAIVCITVSGNTALALASYRPPVPIIAVTFNDDVRRRLTLIRGVECVVLEASPTIDDVLPQVNDLLVRQSLLQVGDRIVFVSITLSSVGREASNLFTIQTLS